MKSVIIHNLPDWRVTSYGNGLAYEIANKRLSLALLFQGDDAAEFRTQIDALTDGPPALDYADALAAIWHDYSEGAAPWEQQP